MHYHNNNGLVVFSVDLLCTFSFLKKSEKKSGKKKILLSPTHLAFICSSLVKVIKTMDNTGASCCRMKWFLEARVLYLRRIDGVKGTVARARRAITKNQGNNESVTHLFFSNSVLTWTVFVDISRESDVSVLTLMECSGTFSPHYLLCPTIPSITITTNSDWGQRKRWQPGMGALHHGIYSISPDLGFPSSVYGGQLAKWTALTITRAQQTHGIVTVCCVWGIAVSLQWLTGMFSHGYPGCKSQNCNWDTVKRKIVLSRLFESCSFFSINATHEMCMT